MHSFMFRLTLLFQAWLGFGMDIPIYSFLVILIIYYAVLCIQEIRKLLSTPNSCHQLGVSVQNGILKIEAIYFSSFML